MKTLLTLILLAPAVALAAEPTLPKERAEAFFSALSGGDVAVAYDRLFVGSSIPINKPQAVEALKSQTKIGLPLYGKILGFDFIKEEKFGSSIVRLVYVLKSEVGPTAWEFYFYKPKESWFIANVLFNDQFSLLR